MIATRNFKRPSDSFKQYDIDAADDFPIYASRISLGDSHQLLGGLVIFIGSSSNTSKSFATSITFGSLSHVPSDARDFAPGRRYSRARRSSTASEAPAVEVEEKEEVKGGEPGTAERRTPFSSYIDPESIRGCIAGGSHLEKVKGEAGGHKDLAELAEVDFSFPLTLTKSTTVNGHDVVLLFFEPNDPENPFNWPESRKKFITILLCSMTVFIGLATTAYSSGINSMTAEFGVSPLIGQLGLFLFNFVAALGPLFLAPFCELVGRRVIYAGAYLGFSIMFIGLTLGKNIGTILVCRALLGLFGWVGTILVGGTFSDMYIEEERARPMALFTFAAIVGTVGAPIYAGFIDQAIGWRWIQGIQGLSNIPLLFLVFFFLKESRGSVTPQARAKKLREATKEDNYMAKIGLETASLKQMLQTSSVKAVKMLITEPVVLGFGLWIAFAWGVTFLFLSLIPITFEEKRGWNEGHESIMKDPNRKALPEDRLYGAMFGAIWLPIGLFMYSFTQYGYLPWIAPIISLAPISFGILFVFESVYSVTADCYGENASSAIAGQGFLRNTLGAVTPLFASQFFHNVGSQYAGLILAVVASLPTTLPFIMYKYGHKLLERSKMAQVY